MDEPSKKIKTYLDNFREYISARIETWDEKWQKEHGLLIGENRDLEMLLICASGC